MHVVASEARTIEVRLAKSDWMVGDSGLGRGHRDLSLDCRCCCARSPKPEAQELSARFLPLEINYPALGALDRGASKRCPVTIARIRRIGAPDAGNALQISATRFDIEQDVMSSHKVYRRISRAASSWSASAASARACCR